MTEEHTVHENVHISEPVRPQPAVPLPDCATVSDQRDASRPAIRRGKQQRHHSIAQ